MTLDRPSRGTGAVARADRVRVVVRRGARGGGIHITLAGFASPASVPRQVGYRLHEDTTATVIHET